MGILTDLDQGIVIIGSSVLFIIVFILLVVTKRQMNKMRNRYNQIVNGGSANNVEQILIGIQDSSNKLAQQNKAQQTELDQIKQLMRKMKSNLSVQRYNAFSQDGGSDLSFSIAILDDEQDGVVLTGIHGREQTYIYAKPVEKGQSKYSLTPEEKMIIDQIAVKSNA